MKSKKKTWVNLSIPGGLWISCLFAELGKRYRMQESVHPIEKNYIPMLLMNCVGMKGLLDLPNSKPFATKAENFSEKNKYVQSMQLNNQAHIQISLLHKVLMAGGILKFVMGNKSAL